MRWFNEFVRRLADKMKGNRPVTDLRPQSIQNIDQNATRSASVLQASADRDDRIAGSPADQGGEA
ncbi:MAG: hypothetical protein ABI577_03715 [bacterium]